MSNWRIKPRARDLEAVLGRKIEAAAKSVAGKMSNATIQNNAGLAAAFNVNVNQSFPANQGTLFGKQISQATTVFENLRYYLVSNFRQILSQAYVEIGLIQTIVDIPVDDGLRGGIELKSKELDESEILELQGAIDRDDDMQTIAQAAKWNRLFGGAGLLILTDQDPETPFDVELLDVGDKVDFHAVDMWELFFDKQNDEGFDPLDQDETFDFYSYYGYKVHRSRVLRLKGKTPPSFIRPQLRGWGFSVVEALVRSINQYLKANDLGFEVLDEFKLDIYKIKNLTNSLMSPQGTQKITERVMLGNYIKNFQNALVMDSEDDYQSKQLSFTGLAEAMSGIRMQVASDMRIPLTKLFGISAAGFNSGEDDIEVYNAMVESEVRTKIKYVILKVVEVKCQVLFGYVPSDLTIDFKPLRVMSSEQEETVKTQKFNRLLQARGAGEISSQQFLDACNKGDLFDIAIDTAEDGLAGYDENEAGADNETTEAQPPGDSGGANKVESQKGTIVKQPDGSGNKTRSKSSSAKPPPDPKKPKTANSDGLPFEVVFKNAKTGEARLITGAALLKLLKNAEDAEKGSVERFSLSERLKRVFSNSAAFDKASYEADGGDLWIAAGRREFFDEDKADDKSLYCAAVRASEQALGERRWQFIVWWYQKQGGRFQAG